MIGLQEMLLQTNGDTIYLFPAWPEDWDVHFKLHAPQNTWVEAELNNGKVKIISGTNLNLAGEYIRSLLVEFNIRCKYSKPLGHDIQVSENGYSPH